MEWTENIVSDPQILLGKPTIKGTRISVELILELFQSGWSKEVILDSYPTLKMQDIYSVFAYLKDCV